MNYSFSFTEAFGVYKWAIDLNESFEHCTLYTNVTGGDWKNIVNPRTHTNLYIFDLEETRPDLIFLIRPANALLVGEAKRSLKLLYGDLDKHAEVLTVLCRELSRVRPGWTEAEAGSTVIPTLAWCSDGRPSQRSEVEHLLTSFSASLRTRRVPIVSGLVGLETVRDEHNALRSRVHLFGNISPRLRSDLVQVADEFQRYDPAAGSSV